MTDAPLRQPTREFGTPQQLHQTLKGRYHLGGTLLMWIDVRFQG